MTNLEKKQQPIKKENIVSFYDSVTWIAVGSTKGTIELFTNSWHMVNSQTLVYNENQKTVE